VDPRIGRRWLAGAALAAALAAGFALAQPTFPPPPTPEAPPPPSLGPVVEPPPMAGEESQSEPEVAAEAPKPKVIEPVGPPRPERSPTAILRVLDKVTAETLRFEAPVGRRIRYKSLVFEVRSCQTWGVHAPDPHPSAYIDIKEDFGSADNGPLGSKQVYKGWMFAEAPGVHALQHPVYDAWLESCEGAPPPTA
jgi:hypothetical protein